MLSRLEFFNKWKILPLHFCDAARRIKWLRKMVFFPADHYQVVSALFGDLMIGGAKRCGALDANLHIILEAPGLSFQIPSAEPWITIVASQGPKLFLKPGMR